MQHLNGVALGLPGRCDICIHQHLRRRRRWHSTYWHMRQCEGVGWHLWWFALMIEICDIKERNVTIKSEIWTTNIHSLGFQDIKEWVTIRGLILRSLGCIMDRTINAHGIQAQIYRPPFTISTQNLTPSVQSRFDQLPFWYMLDDEPCSLRISYTPTVTYHQRCCN